VSSLPRVAPSKAPPTTAKDANTSPTASSSAVRPDISRPKRLSSLASAPALNKPTASTVSPDAETTRSPPPRIQVSYGRAISTPEKARPAAVAPEAAVTDAPGTPGRQVFLGWLAAKAAAEAESDGTVPAGQRILVPLPEGPQQPKIKVEETEDELRLTDCAQSSSDGHRRLGAKEAATAASDRRASPFAARPRSGGMLDVPGVRRPVTPGRRKRKGRDADDGLESSDKENVQVNGEEMEMQVVDEVALPGADKAGKTSKKRKMKRAEALSQMSPPPTPAVLAGYGVKPVDPSSIVGWGTIGAEGTSGKSWTRETAKPGEAWSLASALETS
jgi:hypothetical protein